jgi:hypothetical protein
MDAESLSTSRREFLKGLAIGAGGIAVGSSLIYPAGATAQSIEDRLEKVPISDRWGVAAGSGVFWQFNFYKSLLDKEGREKFTEYAKNYASFAGSGGKGLADRFGFTGNDAKSVSAMIPAAVTIFYGPRQKFEITEATAEKTQVKCLECAFWNLAQAQKISDDLCSTHSQYYWDGFAKAVNPKLTSTLVKAKPRGDSVCEWVIELKA